MPAPDARSGPVADEELDALFAVVEALPAVGLAVSGGPDSTALLLLARRWSARRGGRPALRVLTVDHGLRAAARQEAEDVVRLARSLDLPADLLTWHHDGGTPTADIQAAARDARYRLMADAARASGLAAVLLAHTLDDVAETVLMRLARGSGVRGLAGIPAVRTVAGVRFVRPLLDLRKDRLVATVAAAGLVPADDPSNASDRFQRARIRRLMPALAELGLTPERLAGTARRLARAADAIDTLTDALAAAAVTDLGGVFAVDPDRLRAAPDEAALRLVAGLVRAVRPAAYLPRAAAIEAWFDHFKTAGRVPRRTVAGVVLDMRRDRLWLYAEAGRTGFPTLAVEGPAPQVWDGRFTVLARGPIPAGTMVVAGADRTDMPRAAAASLPRLVGAAPDAVQLLPIAPSPVSPRTKD